MGVDEAIYWLNDLLKDIAIEKTDETQGTTVRLTVHEAHADALKVALDVLLK